MTDSQSSLSEVPALLEERRRYETWLAALEARRESTPQHVFERVQADYRSRLQRVSEQLSSHRQAIEEERTSLQSRLSLLAVQEGQRRDERAELELRKHVGELIGAEADTAFGAIDQAIAQLMEERQALTSRIGGLDVLLAERAGAAVRKPEAAIAPAAPVAGPVAAGLHAVPPSAAPSAVPPASAPARAPAPAEPEVPVAVRPAVEPGRPVAPPSIAPAAPAKPDMVPIAPPDGGVRPRSTRAAFDELAFLSSVVGKTDGGSATGKKEASTVAPSAQTLIVHNSSEPLLKPSGIVQEENAGESLLAGVEQARLATGEHPLAANVPSNTPIVLRPSNTVEQAKTLKCNECGGMNYPTEWYCERCGAELAAL
jgi:hypothetical protein